MDPNLDSRFENSPLFQEAPDADLWEAPFERWLRLADSLLGNVPPARPTTPRNN
jgi:hypothetical protein